MKKFITAALLVAVAMPTAAVALPSTAQAQSRGELRRDREQIREERGELRNAYRSGNPRRIREERRDVREAQREYREDRRDRNRSWGDNDWRDYRGRNRAIYSRGNWRAPFRYQRFRPGVSIGAGFYSRGYHVGDWNRYRLPRPGYNQVWVRHYDDLILVDTRRGRVIRVINGFYW